MGVGEDGKSTLLVAFEISPVSISFLNGLLLERFIRGVSPHHPITPSYPLTLSLISLVEALRAVMPSLGGLYPWDSLVEAQAATADARYELPEAFRLAAAQCF